MSLIPWQAKAAAAAVALAMAFGSGWKLKATFVEAATAEALRLQAADYDQKVAAYTAAVTALATERDAVVSASQQKSLQLSGRIAKLEGEIRNATLQPTGQAPEPRPFSTDFVRLYNGATYAANGAADPVPADPAGAASPAGGTADVTREDVLRTYIGAMKICGTWRQRLQAIRDFQESK